jgi:dTDP-glucose 4,6-dehydratase
MKWCISGGAGFIGSHLTMSLLNDGHRVTILDDFSTGSYANFDPRTRELGALTIYEHDVTEPLPELFGFDVIAHLASIPTPGAYMDQPVQTLTTGATGTRRMLNLARRCESTFLFASTSEVYGNPEEHPQPESYNGNVDPYGPRACYDESKRYAEALVRAYHDEHGVDTRIARIFNTYGPQMRDGRVIPTFMRQAINGDPLTVHGDGTQTRSFCYIDDLIRGLRELVSAHVSTPVNLGDPTEVTIRELAEKINTLTGCQDEPVYTERPPDDPERRRPNITKARKKLDWSPTTDLMTGLTKTKKSMQRRYTSSPDS